MAKAAQQDQGLFLFLVFVDTSTTRVLHVPCAAMAPSCATALNASMKRMMDSPCPAKKQGWRFDQCTDASAGICGNWAKWWLKCT